MTTSYGAFGVLPVAPMQTVGATPESAKQLQEMAAKYLQAGSSSAPIGSWTQGMANVMQSLMGGMMYRRALDQQLAGQQAAAADMQSLLGGGGDGGAAASPSLTSAGSASPAAGSTSTTTAGADGGKTAAGSSLWLDALNKAGFSPLQSAALAGNVQQESSFNPNAYNQKEGAFGGIQWRGDRLQNLKSFAAQTGGSISDPYTQAKFMKWEMSGPEANNAAGFLSASDLQSANAGLHHYIRYGDDSQGTRLANAARFMQSAPSVNVPPAMRDFTALDKGGSADAAAAAAPTGDTTPANNLPAQYQPPAAPAPLPGSTPLGQGGIGADANATPPAANVPTPPPRPADLGQPPEGRAAAVTPSPAQQQIAQALAVPGGNFGGSQAAQWAGGDYRKPGVLPGATPGQAALTGALAPSPRSLLSSLPIVGGLAGSGSATSPSGPAAAGSQGGAPSPVSSAPGAGGGAIGAAGAAGAPGTQGAAGDPTSFTANHAIATASNANDPRMLAAGRILSSPWATSQAQELARNYLTTRLNPDFQTISRPDGSVVVFNKNNPSQTQELFGPLKTNEIKDGPIDPSTGDPTKVIWNPVDGVVGVMRVDANGNTVTVPVGKGVGAVGAPGSSGGANATPAAPGAAGPSATPGAGGATPAGPGGPAAANAVPGSPVPNIKTEREELGRRAAAAAAPSAAEIQEFGSKVTQNQEYQEASVATTQYNSMLHDAQLDGPAASKAMVDAFAKVRNPGRAVGVGQYNVMSDIQSWPAEIQGEISKVLAGQGTLSNQAKALMLRVAEDQVDSLTSKSDAWIKMNRNLVKSRFPGVNPDDVVIPITKGKSIDLSDLSRYQVSPDGQHFYDQKPGIKPEAQEVDPESLLPLGAVQKLRADPSKAAQFDEIFGKGAAARALGQ